LETDQDGKMLTVRKQRAKLINDLPPEFRKLIEDVTVDKNGNVIPNLLKGPSESGSARAAQHWPHRGPPGNRCFEAF
jgi:hypothetical protein